MGSVYAATSLVNIVVIAEKCFNRSGLTEKELLNINELTYKAELNLVLGNLPQSYAADFVCFRNNQYTLRTKNKDFESKKRLEELTRRLGRDPAEIFKPTN